VLAMRGGDDATGNLRQLVWNADGKVSGLPFCVQKAWTQYQSMVSKEKAASANYIHTSSQHHINSLIKYIPIYL
jgi:hypothetical protein